MFKSKRGHIEGLRKAMEIKKLADTLLSFTVEELNGEGADMMACMAWMHYKLLEGSHPELTQQEVDGALVMHRQLVLQWLAANKKE